MTDYSYRVLKLDFSSAKVNELQEMEGQVITYLSGSPDITIRLNTRSNDEITLSTKDRLKLPDKMSFNRFYVTGGSGGGSVELMVGKPDIMVDAGQVYIAGSVIVDETTELKRADEGNSYLFSHRVSSSGAAYGTAGIWNPAASGKNLYVTDIKHNYSIVTIQASLIAINAITAYTFDTTYIHNQLIGGAINTVALGVYGLLTAAQLAATQYRQPLTNFNLAVFVDMALKKPLVINEGFGLVITNNVFGANITNPTFMWFEE